MPPVEPAAHAQTTPSNQQNDTPECDVFDVTAHLLRGESSMSTYWNEGHISALASAVLHFRAALCQSPDGSEEIITAQLGLSDALRLQVDEGTGGDEEREESLALAEAAVVAAASAPALYPDALRALGEVVYDRSRQTTPERLQRAVDTFRLLVDVTSDSRADISLKALALYAQALSLQWSETGNPELMVLANATVDRAIGLCSRDRLARHPDLGFAFMQARRARGSVVGSVDDITEAIEIGEQLVAICLPGYPLLTKFWILLGVLYTNEATFSGDTGGYDDRALHAEDEARQRVRTDHSLWYMCNGNYAASLHARFVARSNLEDLHEAIAITRSVVARMAETGYEHESSYGYVSNLVSYLATSYAQIGNLSALDEAIALERDMRDDLTIHVRHTTLQYFGKCYYMRYTAHGRITDLETAILMQQQALLSLNGPHLQFTVKEVSIELAESLLARFDQGRRLDDVERAISVLRSAVEQPHQGFKGSIYSLLGHALLKKGTALQNVRDLEESILCQHKALDLFPENHSERSLSYHRLGLAEHRVFAIDQRVFALQNSIIAYSHALGVMPSDHPNRAAYLSDLAASQFADADLRGEEITIVLGTLEEAATHAQSWPDDRYAAAASWARGAHRAGMLIVALEAYRLAISILPQVAWLGLEEELRLQRLSRQPPDISQDAAACAIELGLYPLAVEIIEGSRSILWNTSQELRADLGRLRGVAPDLAQELAQTNAALAVRADSGQYEQDEGNQESERRRIHRLAARRTELLHLARSIPEFERFLLPHSYDDLQLVSSQGPVVILNSSTYRCDALVPQADTDVIHVPLPNVTHRLVLEQSQTLQWLLSSVRDRKGQQFLNRVLSRILQWLWDEIGTPILSSLRQLAPYTRTVLPRIWWCPTGVMTSLPLHACGPNNGVGANMTDLVVSSYTPTLSALLRSRARANVSPSMTLPRVLVIAQPELPYRPPLPCALEEARVLHSLIPSLCTFRIGPEATVVRVKDMLHQHNWLHISTHGTQNSIRPLESSIALHDGALKLEDLAHARIPEADFAFLSACHSARGAQCLPDESMHLAAGMMFAGFKSVVATSWAIADKDAPVVARGFYEYLIRDGKTPVVTDTAEALHMAVKHLRDSGVPLYRWIPFIHLGA